jgi:hypothetical protein
VKKSTLLVATLAIILGSTLPGIAADAVAPVRMGSGAMTFDTVPGWGLDENGKSVLGSTHGGVVIDRAGNIYCSANMGVFVFSPDVKLIRRFVGDDYSAYHDIEIRQEGDDEFLYAARNNAAESIKIHAETGDVVLRLPFPKESGLDLQKFAPTAITVAPNGDIILSDGYASNHISAQRGTNSSSSTRLTA